MLEFFVLTTCLFGTGCADTTNAYYLQNAELQRQIRDLETRVKYRIGTEAFTYGSAVMMVLSKREVSFKLYEKLTLKGEPGWHTFYLSYSYPL